MPYVDRPMIAGKEPKKVYFLEPGDVIKLPEDLSGTSLVRNGEKAGEKAFLSVFEPHQHIAGLNDATVIVIAVDDESPFHKSRNAPFHNIYAVSALLLKEDGSGIEDGKALAMFWQERKEADNYGKICVFGGYESPVLLAKKPELLKSLAPASAENPVQYFFGQLQKEIAEEVERATAENNRKTDAVVAMFDTAIAQATALGFNPKGGYMHFPPSRDSIRYDILCKENFRPLPERLCRRPEAVPALVTREAAQAKQG